MSLNVYLTATRPTEVYDANITHNLTRMADAAGIYKACWRPEEIGVTTAAQLIPLLREGLALLRAEPERFQALQAKRPERPFCNRMIRVEQPRRNPAVAGPEVGP